MNDKPIPAIISADPGSLEQRVRQMLAAGRPQAARPMLRVLHGLGAAPSVLAELDARLLMTEGRLHEAEALVSAVIASTPGVAGLHACRAELLVRLDDPAAALPDAAEALLLAPGATDAKALLGVVLIEAGNCADAARCLAEAVEAEPGVSSYRLAYAECLQRLDRADDAAFVLHDGIRLHPHDLALRRAALMNAVRNGDFAGAALLGEAARADGVVDAAVLGLLAHALGALDRPAESFATYADASRLDPDDPYVRHLAAAGGAVPAGPCAPADYIRVLFDGYAHRFDEHILSLGYRVPGLVRAALERLPGVAGPVTDAGCGTGLLAVAADDLAGPWTGVDLSASMLKLARNRGIYAGLLEGDIAQILPTLPPAGLLLAGDVLCYFGALDGILDTMCRHLQSGGHAVFSVEELADGAFGIFPQARFRHGEAHVRAAAAQAGLQVVSLDRETLRWEAGEPVAGFIVVLRAP